MMDNIYIELGFPRELLVAVRTGGVDYALNYEVYTIEYGRDLLHRIGESKAFEKITLQDLPESLTDDFEFRRRFADRFENAYIHIKNKDGQ